MAELKFPTLEELGKQGGEWALDGFEYKGLTIRQWADKITTGEYQPVKHGHWIRTSENVSTIISPVQHCSECGHNTNYDFPYCSNCGAEMDGGVDE